MRRLGRLAPLLLIAVVTACGTTADPAEVEDLASLHTAESNPLGAGLSEAQAECRARVFLESDLSDEALDAIRAGEPPAAATDDDIEVLRDLADELAEECLAPE